MHLRHAIGLPVVPLQCLYPSVLRSRDPSALSPSPNRPKPETRDPRRAVASWVPGGNARQLRYGTAGERSDTAAAVTARSGCSGYPRLALTVRPWHVTGSKPDQIPNYPRLPQPQPRERIRPCVWRGVESEYGPRATTGHCSSERSQTAVDRPVPGGGGSYSGIDAAAAWSPMGVFGRGCSCTVGMERSAQQMESAGASSGLHAADSSQAQGGLREKQTKALSDEWAGVKLERLRGGQASSRGMAPSTTLDRNSLLRRSTRSSDGPAECLWAAFGQYDGAQRKETWRTLTRLWPPKPRSGQAKRRTVHPEYIFHPSPGVLRQLRSCVACTKARMVVGGEMMAEVQPQNGHFWTTPCNSHPFNRIKIRRELGDCQIASAMGPAIFSGAPFVFPGCQRSKKRAPPDNQKRRIQVARWLVEREERNKANISRWSESNKQGRNRLKAPYSTKTQ
ncbi:hypothetical protein FB45DRAFT_1000321 [Roridomyces roridus]|uniref:Uncharacterized protein n=1 Tax=Roridomyces roridus TaxID=1738132 RepID=A0AAD7C891_9AGAR|nr:hypothetical protein FB45DRAFT_1000321 [Roridomyces roridus]